MQEGTALTSCVWLISGEHNWNFALAMPADRYAQYTEGFVVLCFVVIILAIFN